jgi:hypothetical protein
MIEFLSANQAQIIGFTIFIIGGLYAAVLTGKLGNRNKAAKTPNDYNNEAPNASIRVRSRIENADL